MRIWSVVSAEGGRTFFYKRDKHTPTRAIASFTDDKLADAFLAGMQAAFAVMYKDMADLAKLLEEEQEKQDSVQ